MVASVAPEAETAAMVAAEVVTTAVKTTAEMAVAARAAEVEMEAEEVMVPGALTAALTAADGGAGGGGAGGEGGADAGGGDGAGADDGGDEGDGANDGAGRKLRHARQVDESGVRRELGHMCCGREPHPLPMRNRHFAPLRRTQTPPRRAPIAAHGGPSHELSARTADSSRRAA